jgi:hypothetical protein
MCELLPNKRIRIVIPFHHLLFLGITIHFLNVMDIPQTKRGLSALNEIHILIPHFSLKITKKKKYKQPMMGSFKNTNYKWQLFKCKSNI